MPDFKRGDQVCYVPEHIKDQAIADAKTFQAKLLYKYEGVEFGFITSVGADSAFVRYWSKDLQTLRTRANSERTPLANLIKHEAKPQEQIDAMLY